ncbi:MAG: CHAT domain-containing protein [Desulfobacterales bacterium]|nr:CHAT domain-containing protein [Desulfobacterales bacterium]
MAGFYPAVSTWGKYEKAIYEYEKALAIDREQGKKSGISRGLSNLGTVYHSLGQHDRAIENYKKALEIDKQLEAEPEIAIRLNNIAQLYDELGEHDTALENCEKALEIAKKIGAEESIALYLENIGAIYNSVGDYDKAIDSLKKSIQLKEKIRKTAKGQIRRNYLDSQIHTYQFLASVFLKKGDPQGVFDAIEQGRARFLAEQVAGVDSNIKKATLAEIQKGLTEDEAVLIFSNMNRDAFILMGISSEEIVMKEISKANFQATCNKEYKKPVLMLLEKQRGVILPSEEENYISEKKKPDFETAIHYYRALLTNPDNKKDMEAFGKLIHTLLMEPVSKMLTGKTKLTILPDGILGFLPFETLIDQKNRYLVQEYDISYLQSLTIKNLLQNRNYAKNNNRKTMLAMGGAVYEENRTESELLINNRQLKLLQDDVNQNIQKGISVRSAYYKLGKSSWADLPGTLEEVHEISTIITDCDSLTGDQVTEDRIKKYSLNGQLANYKILHFATHGLVIPEMPELSAIVLSQFQKESDGEDGYLRMGEIAKLNISADFVNLSACETGLGRIYGGEGIVGLTQSFLIAGANGLSVSLWQVADKSTSIFMTELYKRAQSTGMNYDVVLTRVKRSFIKGDFGKKHTAPYYWAPFVYYGR